MLIINRFLKQKILQSLNSSPIVFINGPRQAGKSTLVQDIAQHDYPADYVTFDYTLDLTAAVQNPMAFRSCRSYR